MTFRASWTLSCSPMRLPPLFDIYVQDENLRTTVERRSVPRVTRVPSRSDDPDSQTRQNTPPSWNKMEFLWMKQHGVFLSKVKECSVWVGFENIGYWCMIFLYRQLIDYVLFVILDPKDSQMDYRNLLKHRFYILMNHIHCISKALTLSVYLIQTEHQYITCKYITYCNNWFHLIIINGNIWEYFIEITRKMKRMTRTLTGDLSNQVELFLSSVLSISAN